MREIARSILRFYFDAVLRPFNKRNRATNKTIAAIICQTVVMSQRLIRPEKTKAEIAPPPRSTRLKMLCIVERMSSDVSLFSNVIADELNMEISSIKPI